MTTTMLSTQLTCHLSLTTITKKDNAIRLSIIPLFHLTPLIFWLWAIRQTVVHHRSALSDIAGAILELADACGMAAAVYLAVGEIIVKSVLWGVASWPT